MKSSIIGLLPTIICALIADHGIDAKMLTEGKPLKNMDGKMLQNNGGKGEPLKDIRRLEGKATGAKSKGAKEVGGEGEPLDEIRRLGGKSTKAPKRGWSDHIGL